MPCFSSMGNFLLVFLLIVVVMSSLISKSPEKLDSDVQDLLQDEERSQRLSREVHKHQERPKKRESKKLKLKRKILKFNHRTRKKGRNGQREKKKTQRGHDNNKRAYKRQGNQVQSPHYSRNSGNIKKKGLTKEESKKRKQKEHHRQTSEVADNSVGGKDVNLDIECMTKLFKFSNLNGKKVPTIIKQIKLIERSYGLLEKKIKKKDSFQNHFQALKAALTDCNLLSNPNFVNETQPLQKLFVLATCPTEIEKNCNKIKNSTLSASLTSFDEVAVKFALKMKECSSSTLSIHDKCACLDEISRFDVVTIQDCDLNDEKDIAIKYKADCLKSISECKTAAVQSTIIMHNCHLDKCGMLPNDIMTASGGNVDIEDNDDNVDNVDNGDNVDNVDNVDDADN